MRTEIEAAERQEIIDISGSLISKVDALNIVDDEGLAVGADLKKIISAQIKKAEEKRKEYTGPLNAVVKSLNSEFKQMTGPLTTALASLTSKINSYLQKKEREERIERERKAKEIEEKTQKEQKLAEAFGLNEEKETLKKMAQAAIAHVTHERAPPVRSDHGTTVSLKREWDFEVEDITKVPPEFLLINSAAIRKMLQGYVRQYKEEAEKDGLKGTLVTLKVTQGMEKLDIPGIKIFQKIGSMVR